MGSCECTDRRSAGELEGGSGDGLEVWHKIGGWGDQNRGAI